MERISRDTLGWLLVSLALILALHAPHLPTWLTLLAVAIGAWRYAIAWRGWKLPRLYILLPMTLGGMFAILVTYQSLFTRSGSTALLTLMLVLKTLETKDKRDVMLLVFLSYFLAVTSFLFSQMLVFGLLSTLPVLTLAVTLISVNHPNGNLPWQQRVRLAATMLGQALPVMLVLFLLFPRINGPLWGFTQETAIGVTGLSDSMAPGSISQLSQSDSVAFRVAFKGVRPPAKNQYWRGPVLWEYDGRTWSIGRHSLRLPMDSMRGIAEPVQYTITLEPHNKHWMFALDIPATIPPQSKLTHDYQILAHEPLRQRAMYDGASYLDYALGEELSEETRQTALQLPAVGNEKARELAASWRDSAASPDAIAQLALAYIHDQPFVYTLQPPLLGQNAVDEFLFGTRKGFCEHYAGAFVFLMRAAGVPARIVTGYQGGEFNPSGNYMLVRQSDAHAWAEVWLPGRGWVRQDPTAAVAPQRVEAGMAAAVPANEPVPILVRKEFTWLNQLYLQWDYANYGWNKWVLGYNQKRQNDFLSSLAGSKLSLHDITVGMMLAVGGVVSIISLFIFYGGRQNRDPALHLWHKLQKKLARHGVSPIAHEGPLDYINRAASAIPAKAATLRKTGQIYMELRYGNNPGRSLEQLKLLIGSL